MSAFDASLTWPSDPFAIRLFQEGIDALRARENGVQPIAGVNPLGRPHWIAHAGGGVQGQFGQAADGRGQSVRSDVGQARGITNLGRSPHRQRAGPVFHARLGRDATESPLVRLVVDPGIQVVAVAATCGCGRRSTYFSYGKLLLCLPMMGSNGLAGFELYLALKWWFRSAVGFSPRTPP